LKFPLYCKHTKQYYSEDIRVERNEYYKRQRRVPNWVFKSGKFLKGSVMNGMEGTCSKIPDFIGCQSFGKFGFTRNNSCNIVPLPNHLQGANPLLVSKIVEKAKLGIFPSEKYTYFHLQCQVEPFNTKKRFCHSSFHGYEAVELKSIKCDAVYHLYRSLNENDKWGVIVGHSEHTHIPLSVRASKTEVNKYVRDIIKFHPSMKCTTISSKVREQFGGRCAPQNSIVKIKQAYQSSKRPFGTSLNAIIQAMHTRQLSGKGNYIIFISDEREEDELRSTKDQKGLIIIFGNIRLVDHASKIQGLVWMVLSMWSETYQLKV